MYCRFCGGEIEKDSRFCKHCGKSLIEEITQEETIPDGKEVLEEAPKEFYMNIEEGNKNLSTSELTCSVCGKNYGSDRTSCPYCLADFIQLENRTDKFGCGYFNEAEKKEKCEYYSECTHKDCQYCKPDMKRKSKQALEELKVDILKNKGTVSFVIIGVIFLLMLPVFLGNRSSTNQTQPKSEKEKGEDITDGQYIITCEEALKTQLTYPSTFKSNIIRSSVHRGTLGTDAYVKFSAKNAYNLEIKYVGRCHFTGRTLDEVHIVEEQ